MNVKLSRSKKYLFTVLMLLLTFLLCFSVLEFGFARFYYSNISTLEDKEFDPVLGWHYRPGSYWIKPPQSLRKHIVYINKSRIRNEDIKPNLETENRSKRIIILGDSFSFGKTVPFKDIFPTRLEKNLNQISPDRYEVINAGVEGYGTAQQLLFLKKLADDDIIGDIYLLVVFTNDITENLRMVNYLDGTFRLFPSLPGYILNQNGTVELKYPPQKVDIPFKKERRLFQIVDVLKINIESFLQTKPALVSYLNKYFNLKFPQMPGFINAWYNEEVQKAGIPLMKRLIKEIQNEASRHNSKLYVCFIPSVVMVYAETYGPILKKTFPQNPHVQAWLKDGQKPSRIMRQICSELALPFFDFYPIFVKNNDKALYVPREAHLNKMGHKIVSPFLAQFIADQE